MPKNLIIFVLTLFISVGVVSAQETNTTSPFADLSDKSNTGITKVQNYKISEYTEAVDDYSTLLSNYEKAYGDQKEALGKNLITEARSVLFLKMGVVKSRLENFEAEYKKMNFSDENKESLSTLVSSYNDFVTEKESEINSASSITALRSLSAEINKQISDTLYFLNSYRVDYSIEKSVSIIDSLSDYIKLIANHLSAASEAGADINKIGADFSEAADELSEAKTRLRFLQEQAKESLTEDIITEVEELAEEVISNFGTVGGTVTSLQYRYGETPWTLN